MRKNRGVLLRVVAILAALFIGGLLTHNASATSGINQEISFEGKLVNTDGTNIPDGTYNMEFKLYTAAGSCNPTTGAGCTLGWTEDWLAQASHGVAITSGTFEVNLDSVAANNFSGIDFNSYPLYLSVNLGNTSNSCSTFATCSPDGEMKPYILFTSTPYSLNSNAVGGLTASQLVQLTPSSQQSGSINVSGNITSGGTVQANTIDAATSGALTLGSGNATSISVAKNTSVTSANTLTVAGNNALSLGSTTAAGGLIFQDGTSNNYKVTLTTPALSGSYTLNWPTTAPSTSQCLQTSAGSATLLTFSSCGSGSATLQTAYTGGNTITLTQNTPVTIKDSAAASTTNLFQIQNNGATSTYFGVSTNGISVQSTSTTALLIQNGSTNALAFDASGFVLKVYDSTAANFASIAATTNSATFKSNTGTTIVGGGSGNVNVNLTGQNDQFVFNKNYTTAATYSLADFDIQRQLTAGANLSNGSVLKVEDLSTGTNASSAPALLLLNQGNSSYNGSTSYLIQGQLAGSNKFTVDTGGNVAGGTVNSSTGYQVGGAAASGNFLRGNGTNFVASAIQAADIPSGSGNYIQNGTSQQSANFNIANNGATTSVTATIKQSASQTGDILDVQYSGGGNILSINANNNLVQIGASDATQTNLALDQETGYADTGTCGSSASSPNGALYYNTASNSIRVCTNSNWEDLPSTAGLGILLFGAVIDTGNNPGDYVSVTGAGVNGPCKVSWATATSIHIEPCTAYSGGRKVIVPSTNLNLSSAGGGAGMPASSFAYVCLNGSNNQPQINTASTTETSAVLPTWSVNNPVLCLAELDTTTSANTLAKIWDDRVFTNDVKEFGTDNTSTITLGQAVNQTTTAGVVAPVAATTAKGLRGIVMGYSGTASATAINVIIVSNGPSFTKGMTGTITVGGTLMPSATSGDTITGTATAGEIFGTLLKAPDTTCTATTNCQFAGVVDLDKG